ncbi:hypothetical protein [Nonomuraea aurantiaca]|uniref:hypothetical protein n=1 Tax=Nonomuraea aurantiaca TaxID=2878562 RepID=UPI001CD95719|nr:hypothetical protein [Nonomuraea aurantiaca]MCA2229611.1 hypothetical protein [Nonomuraea aurantiaca]
MDPQQDPQQSEPRQPWFSSLGTVQQILIAFLATLAAFCLGVGVVLVANRGSTSEGEATPLTDQDVQELREYLPPTARPSSPTGLTFQQKQQILFKFCTSSQMRGPVGDSSAYPHCMVSYYVTDQGMVMPK